MEVKSAFRGLKNKTKEVTVGGETIKIKPKVKDAEIFISLSRETTEQDAAKITQIIHGMIKRANPDEDDEDIVAHIAEYYGEWIKTIAEVYGFATAKEFDEMRKKLISR
jgi:hypothetical protein